MIPIPKRREPSNYDGFQPHRQSDHGHKITVGHLKAERLRVKNMRRAQNGLPPVKSYAEI